MRKVLILALGLASLGALASVQPASAEPKQVCRWRVIGAYIGDVETGPFGIGFKTCRTVDGPPTPTTPWQGSISGYGKPIQELKTKRQN